MSYKVWSTIKGKKPVVMSFGEIKTALVKGELSMNDEYEEHFGQLGAISRGMRLRLGDVRVFRDARADAARERAEALTGPNTGSGRTFGVLNQNWHERCGFWFRLRVGTA